MHILKLCLPRCNVNVLNSRRVFPKLLLDHRRPNLNVCLTSNFCQKFSQNASGRGKPKLPDLLYVPHVFRWLSAKYRLKYLQKMWDPEFTEGGFIYGTTHAICKITDIISRNKPDELDSLVENHVKEKLKQYMRIGLSEHQKRAIRLQPDDIKLLVPMKVAFDTKQYQKRCNVLLKTLAMKWFTVGNSLKLVLIVIETEFSRDYTKGTDSEWNISTFNILQCTLVNNRLS
ncbi:uncharacterized protein [Onthophagus taurus]|uniref:uncharacterized protein n=1 Tax=Onthophagus taurus TaxID=166361 RepID=UPI0039BE1B12